MPEPGLRAIAPDHDAHVRIDQGDVRHGLDRRLRLGRPFVVLNWIVCYALPNVSFDL